jgi:arylformamidase
MLLAEVAARLLTASAGSARSVLTLSGLFDLQPLRFPYQQLDAAGRCCINSPRFLPGASTHGQCQLRVSCGEFDHGEFKRQSREYQLPLAGALSVGAADWRHPTTNHFDLPLQLADPQSPFIRPLQLMGLDQSRPPPA